MGYLHALKGRETNSKKSSTEWPGAAGECGAAGKLDNEALEGGTTLPIVTRPVSPAAPFDRTAEAAGRLGPPFTCRPYSCPKPSSSSLSALSEEVVPHAGQVTVLTSST